MHNHKHSDVTRVGANNSIAVYPDLRGTVLEPGDLDMSRFYDDQDTLLAFMRKFGGGSNTTNASGVHAMPNAIFGPHHVNNLDEKHLWLLQCRQRHNEQAACTNESWLIHWPAHGWWDMVLRIVNMWTGSQAVTILSKTIEKVFCNVYVLWRKDDLCKHVLDY